MTDPDRSPRPKAPRKITAAYLERAALFYLERYASSVENLRRVLMDKVRRSCHYHGDGLEEAAAFIDPLLEKLVSKGLLNDQDYGQMRALSLHRRGTSLRAIRLKLAQKGLSEDAITKSLTGLEEEIDSGNLERDAAINLAKRRRMGPWRSPEKREAYRDKDLAAMARAGFGYDLSRDIIDAETSEDLSD